MMSVVWNGILYVKHGIHDNTTIRKTSRLTHFVLIINILTIYGIQLSHAIVSYLQINNVSTWLNHSYTKLWMHPLLVLSYTLPTEISVCRFFYNV